jgi:hypothetical protein
VPTSRVKIDVLTHQVYSSRVGLNAPEKLKTEKNSKNKTKQLVQKQKKQ